MTSSDPVLSEILGRLDVAVLRRLENGTFETCGTPPDWFEPFFGPDPAERSFFLADFIEQGAAEHWAAPDSGEPARSGLWEETGPDGDSRFFEAIALTAGDAAILLIEAADERHDREQMFVQQWHVDTLDRRRLGKEIEKKEILLDCIVHDLTHPLSTIMVNLQHLGKKIGDEKLQRSVDRALAQAERQRDLIRAISETFRSDLSAFDPLAIPAAKRPDLSAVTADILDAHAETAAERGIELDFCIGSDLRGIRVIAEESHLARVLENLVVNAIRHSPEGGTVTVSLHQATDSEQLVASIEDEGPGVDPTDLETLFKPFAQGSGGNGGQAGLGLYFCKMMIELWGGEIYYAPATVGGAAFWFQLPIASDTPGS